MQQIGVVTLLSVEDRPRFQRQSERQINYQSVKADRIRVATSLENVEREKAALEKAGCTAIFIFDGKGYYARDYIESVLMFGEECPYDISWVPTEKKPTAKRAREIMRTEFPFFNSLYGF